jgi:hypothetical protein
MSEVKEQWCADIDKENRELGPRLFVRDVASLPKMRQGRPSPRSDLLQLA